MRMSYPEPMCVIIKNHPVFAQSQHWGLSTEAEGSLVLLRIEAGFAHWNIPPYNLKHCSTASPIVILFFLPKKKKKVTNKPEQCKRKAAAREQCVLCNAFSLGTSIAGNKIKSLKPSLKLHLPLPTFSNLSNKLTFAIVPFFWISFLTDLTSTIYHKAFSSCLELRSMPSP